MPFQGRVAVVTGGKGALGSVLVRFFQGEGAAVAVPYRGTGDPSSQELHFAAERTFLRQADLSSEKSVHAFFREVEAHLGPVDFLVNGAGGYVGGSPVEDVTLEEWEEMMESNLKSAFLTCKSVLSRMKERRCGRIINIAAMAALSPLSGRAPYAISKRGVITLTETIAAEVKGTGVTANAIAPSIILTESNRASMPDAEISKWVRPEEIAKLVGYLCSDDARSISGNVIKIYGGI